MSLTAEQILPDTSRKIDIDKAVQLRLNGVSVTDIAKVFDCSKSAVSQALAPYKQIPKGYNTYKQRKAEILELKQYQVVDALNLKEIKNMPAGTKVTAIGILEDKIRLIRGESTANISVHTVVEDLEKRKQELLSKLKNVDNPVDK